MEKDVAREEETIAWVEASLKAGERGWTERLLGLASLLLLLTVYVIQVQPELASNQWATDDEIGYLSGSIEIRETWGGPLGVLRGLVDGTFTRAERGPLYMALLASFAERSLATFDRARAMDFWLGLAGLMLLFLATWRWYGLAAGLALVLVLVANPYYLNTVAVVGAEVVFIPLVALTLLVLARGMQQPAWLPLGFALIGMSFLTKSNGFFLIAPALLAWAAARGRTFWRERALWLALAAFLVVASPLLIRNVRLAGDPLYNPNTRLLWIDEYEVSRTEEFRQQGASLAGYLRTHTVADIAGRLVQGTEQQIELLARVMGAPLASPIVGYVVLALALIGFVAVGSPAERLLFGLTFVGFVLFFGWMTRVWYLPHYTLPIVPTTYLAAFLTIGRIEGWGAAWWRLKRPSHPTWSHPAVISVLAFVIIALAGALGAAIVRVEIPPAQESPEVAALREWVISHMTDSDRYIIGPEREFRFEWYTEMPGKRYSVPAMGSFAELQAYLDAYGINWLVVTPRQYARRQAVFEDWIVYHEPDKFMYARPIPGWEMVDYDRLGDSVDYLIYRRNPDAPQHSVYLRETPEHVFRLEQPPAYPVDVNFGNAIALRGFNVASREVHPGQEVDVTLHWQRLSQMNIGYTAFVHLLDEAESRVWGQQDKPPRAGAYPTNQWLLDEVVSERYRFTVPPDTPAGMYKLEVGWYDLATGQRLAVQPGPGVSAGDRYLLPVTVSVLAR